MRTLNLFFKSFITLAVCSFSLISCNTTDKQLRSALELAGDNKDELLKVIDYYQKEPADSLKLEAAKYLIKNMEDLYTLDTLSVLDNDSYFNCLDRLYKKINSRPTFQIVSRAIDNYITKMNINPVTLNARYNEDLKTLNARFLIQNIDNAYNAWQNYPWSQQFSFETFCEYILPYRCSNTFMDNSREYFFKKYSWVRDSVKTNKNCFNVEKLITNEIESWYDEDGTILRKYPFLSPIKFSNIIKGRIGTCEQANSLKSTALMSLGIPVAMEFVPQWGNYNNSHSFYRVLDYQHDTITKLLTNIDSYRNVSHIISGTSTTSYSRVDELPSYIKPVFNKTVPKVYRNCFTRQEKSLPVVNTCHEEIPELFKNTHILDVSDQYIETTDVSLKISLKNKHQYAYLCVFSFNGWKPVQWSTVSDTGETVFRNMGKNIVYLPAYWNSQGIIPCGSPFLLQQDGSMKSLYKNEETQTISVWRKYPYFMHVAEWASYMIGGKFQGSNSHKLSSCNTFYTIKTLPCGMKEVPVTDKQKYRYLLYRFENMPLTFPAEIEFYGIVNGKEEKLSGEKIGNKGLYGFSDSSVWDGDRNTYFFYDSADPLRYVGIDLGKNNECRVTKIKYYPRSDTNDILPGEKYELFYWDYMWISLGKQTGIDMKPLEYDHVPKNVLFLLHADKGNEERIFTYEDGKQIWW